MECMEYKLLKALNNGVFKAHLLMECAGCTNISEFCEAMLNLVRDKKIRMSEITGYYEVI